MTVFFFYLTCVTYFLSHSWAKKTQPQDQQGLSRNFVIKGAPEAFSQALESWANKQPLMEIIEMGKDQALFEKQASWFSYGYYLHVNWGNTDNVQVRVQAKLVTTSVSHQLLDKKLPQDLPLDHAG